MNISNICVREWMSIPKEGFFFDHESGQSLGSYCYDKRQGKYIGRLKSKVYRKGYKRFFHDTDTGLFVNVLREIKKHGVAAFEKESLSQQEQFALD